MLSQFAPILVVDDSATTRRVVKAMLSQLGYINLLEATDGTTALGISSRRSLALIISDWLMEPMSGLDLLKLIRKSEYTRSLPFIMMTSQSQRKFVEVARDEGATHYLAKPFRLETLASKLAALGEQRLGDRWRSNRLERLF